MPTFQKGSLKIREHTENLQGYFKDGQKKNKSYSKELKTSVCSLTAKRLRSDIARHKYFHREKIPGPQSLPDLLRKGQTERAAGSRSVASSKPDTRQAFYIMNKPWKGTDDSHLLMFLNQS